jgi:hypothetical protein
MLGQDSLPERCATQPYSTLDEEDIGFAKRSMTRFGKTNGIVKIIPVAVHVVYSNENDANNISDAQINDQITILNDDFRGRSGGLDTEIEFCLAGINRIQDAANSIVYLGTNDATLKLSIQEDPTIYLNCWVVDEIYYPSGAKVLGSSTFPKELANAPQLDGVIIADHNFGSIGTASNSQPYHKGRTAVHEFGHWLNLFHVFQNGCDDKWTCEFSGDCCCDTPPQDIAVGGCKTLRNSCHGDDPDEKDPVRNYMGYSNDNCMREFTDCQKGRMHEALETYRPNGFFTSGDCPPFKREISAQAPQFPLLSIFPNPFNNETTILIEDFSTFDSVDLLIIDVTGKIIEERSIICNSNSPGSFKYEFSASPGIYFCKLRWPEGAITKKLVCLP